MKLKARFQEISGSIRILWGDRTEYRDWQSSIGLNFIGTKLDGVLILVGDNKPADASANARIEAFWILVYHRVQTPLSHSIDLSANRMP